MEIFPWQRQLWRKLVEQFQANRLPHALLLVGSEGIGKLTLARQLAALLLCQQSSNSGMPCQGCSGCTLLAAGNHPDFMEIQVESGQFIKVDQIRTVNEMLASTSHQGGWRIVIFEQADLMNLAASNALLKTLEEPPAGTLIILTTDSIGILPATIRSRCQILSIGLDTNDVEVKAWLNDNLSQDNISWLLAWANYAPLKAKFLSNRKHLVARRTMLEQLHRFALHQSTLETVWEATEAFTLEEVLLQLMQLVVDLLKLKFYPGGEIINQDYRAELAVLSASLKLRELFSYQDRLNQFKRYLLEKFNLNQQLVLEGLLIAWQACFIYHPPSY